MHYTCPHCSTINRLPLQDFTASQCGRCKHPLFIEHPYELNEADFQRFLNKNDLPIVIDFWASWCGPCQMMGPIFSQLGQEMQKEARFVKINTEHNQHLASQLNIRSIPTLILFHRGKEIARISGALPAPQLKQWIQQHLPKHP